MNKILLNLMEKFHVRKISDDEFAIICSYKNELDGIVEKYNAELITWNVSSSGLSVWGMFKLRRNKSE